MYLDLIDSFRYLFKTCYVLILYRCCTWNGHHLPKQHKACANYSMQNEQHTPCAVDNMRNMQHAQRITSATLFKMSSLRKEGFTVNYYMNYPYRAMLPWTALCSIPVKYTWSGYSGKIIPIRDRVSKENIPILRQNHHNNNERLASSNLIFLIVINIWSFVSNMSPSTMA